MKERRQHKRLAIKIPVKWRSAECTKRNLAEAFLFDTHNITKAGLFLKTPLQPKRDSLIALELIPNNKSKPISIKGRVIWLAKKRCQSHLYPGIGVKLEGVPHEEYQRLNAFIKNKFDNFREAHELKNMYLKLKEMASRLVELEERHLTATHFKKIIDNAIIEIDDVAHLLDREINEIKKM